MVDRANKVIKQIFDSEKYDLILQDPVVFAGPRVDITDKVIKAPERRAGQVTPDFSVRLHELQAGLGRTRRRCLGARTGERLIRRIGPLRGRRRRHDQLSRQSALSRPTADTDAGCVIVSAAARDAVRPGCVALVVPDPTCISHGSQWWAARTVRSRRPAFTRARWSRRMWCWARASRSARRR